MSLIIKRLPWISMLLAGAFGLMLGEYRPSHVEKLSLAWGADEVVQLSIRLPDYLWKGGRGKVTLTMYLEPADPSATQLFPSGSTFETWLSMTRGGVEPHGVYQTKLNDRSPVSFSWEIVNPEDAPADGVLWLKMQPFSGAGNDGTLPLLSREVQVPTRSLWGMSFIVQRWISAALLLFGGSGLLLVEKLVRRRRDDAREDYIKVI